jgi:hypothetical protein
MHYQHIYDYLWYQWIMDPTTIESAIDASTRIYNSVYRT